MQQPFRKKNSKTKQKGFNLVKLNVGNLKKKNHSGVKKKKGTFTMERENIIKAKSP